MTVTPDDDGAFERGRKEGRTEALLEAHTAHLAEINGSLGRSADAQELVALELRSLASDIRTLQEDGRLAAERVAVAADTLATETERRRSELQTVAETGDRRFSKRERLAGLALTGSVAAIGFYFRHAISRQGGNP